MRLRHRSTGQAFRGLLCVNTGVIQTASDCGTGEGASIQTFGRVALCDAQHERVRTTLRPSPESNRFAHHPVYATSYRKTLELSPHLPCPSSAHGPRHPYPAMSPRTIQLVVPAVRLPLAALHVSEEPWMGGDTRFSSGELRLRGSVVNETRGL